MNPNIFDANHPEKWYLLIEYMPDNTKIVRAAGSLQHCTKYNTRTTMAIINYTSAQFFGI